jgi:mannan endo-1,4-beta-mannosidase
MEKKLIQLLLFSGKRRLIYILLFCCSQVSLAQLGTLVTSVEAENGVLAGGVTVSSAVTGYSGAGYVTNFKNSADKVTVTVNAPGKGFYSIVIRYNSTSGNKTQNLIVNNGGSSSVVFPQTSTYSDLNAGKYVLNAGANSITVQSNWGWMDVDKFTIYTAVANTYNIAPDLIDAAVDSTTKSLYSFLVSHFGENIISGQTSDYYDTIKSITGKSPMLITFDFQHYTQGYSYLWANGGFSFGWDDNGATQKAITWYNSANKKGIVSFQWHWHSPGGGTVGTNTFYTANTTFDITKAVQSGTPENIAAIRDIDSIATQLKKLQNAGVPVLWRPLHEAGGGWFWWGAKGPVACKQLYAILYNRLTNYHKIHNLIWVWSTPETAWYPGNDSVDIAGYDSYPSNFDYGIQKNAFDVLYNLTGGHKLITMSENGAIPDPNDCLTMDAPWSYFMSWGNLVKTANTNVHINDVFTNPNVLTLENPTPVKKISAQGMTGYRVFPNPARETVQIDGGSFTRLELIDLNGRIVFKTTNPMHIINIQQYQNDVYILKIYNNQEFSFYKLIINK